MLSIGHGPLAVASKGAEPPQETFSCEPPPMVRHVINMNLPCLQLDLAVSCLFWSGLRLPGCMRWATFELEMIWPRDPEAWNWPRHSWGSIMGFDNPCSC